MLSRGESSQGRGSEILGGTEGYGDVSRQCDSPKKFGGFRKYRYGPKLEMVDE